MEQEHVDAIRAMVLKYCEEHGLVSPRHQLEVHLIIEPVMAVKVRVANGNLDEVLSGNLREAFESWRKSHENWGDVHGKLQLKILCHLSPKDRVGDFCRISESHIRGLLNVDDKIISVVQEFLSWLDSRLTIGCTKEHPPFPWEEK